MYHKIDLKIHNLYITRTKSITSNNTFLNMFRIIKCNLNHLKRLVIAHGFEETVKKLKRIIYFLKVIENKSCISFKQNE